MQPSNASHEALLTMARGMLEKATLHKDVLVKRGMSEQVRVLDGLVRYRFGDNAEPIGA